jgi:hypothetical protein
MGWGEREGIFECNGCALLQVEVRLRLTLLPSPFLSCTRTVISLRARSASTYQAKTSMLNKEELSIALTRLRSG